MEKEEGNKLFGLVGKDISYSFSKGYFTQKFEDLGATNCKYVNFDIKTIDEFSRIIHQNKFELKGVNVTIPYKEEIIPFLNKLSKSAKKIGAVNTIKITKKGLLKGFNTDVFGFENAIKPLLKKHHKRALILGTGGASKAVAFALKKNKIKIKFVSRNPKSKNEISYKSLDEVFINKYKIIINCTPLGTHPNINDCPNIPYNFLTQKHLLFDLIYNPFETTFLSKGKAQGATIKNGLEMLELQAEKSWEIWNK